MTKNCILFSLFCCFFTSLFSQDKFTGRVIDNNTKEALAFVNVIYNSKNYGTTTDLDGYFSIDSYDKIEFLKTSYLGYKTKIIDKQSLGSKYYIEIKLEEEAFQLAEVKILPGINPAHRIIEEVIKNADINDPEKMRSFSYVSYNRMHFTVDSKMFLKNEDSVSDTLFEAKDTNTNRIVNLLDSQHLFMMESITERKFRYPDNNKEVVMAQRISGLKNPGFVLITSQLQSISFYKDYITILEKKYLSPVSKGSTKRYFFQMEDTLYNERADTVFIISYRPLYGKNFDGIQGVLHINTNGYAIQNVKAKPYERSSAFDINIQQKFELIDDIQWFPVQLNTDLILNFAQVSSDSISSPMIGIGKTYISDISLNPDHKRREFNQLDVVVKDDAHKKDEEFWDKYRNEPLTAKDKKTYEVIDSLSEEYDVEKYLDIIEIVAAGYIPWKFLNFDLSSLYWYNNYEGSRLGLGLSTNDRLLPWVSLGGYFAYGFKDKAWKYGGNVNFLLHRTSNTRLEVGYKKDLFLSDNFSFHNESDLLSSNVVLDMFFDQMDPVTHYYTCFQSSIFKYLKYKIKFSYTEKDISNAQRYDYIYPINDHYFNSEIGIYLRYAFKEKFMQTPRGNRISLGTIYPIISFNIIKSLDFLDAESDFLKFETSVYKKFTIRNAGELNILFSGALIDKIAPYSQLYYITGVASWLSFDNVFNTMGVNEFISDKFATIFLKHDFQNVLFKSKWFNPRLSLVTSAGWGDAKLVGENYLDGYAKLMNKGYFESGIQINSLLTLNKIFGYGLGVYYRYGPYARSKEIDNWAFKMTITFNLR